jgi:uncharacterized protein YjfI (DUF2170 family)
MSNKLCKKLSLLNQLKDENGKIYVKKRSHLRNSKNLHSSHSSSISHCSKKQKILEFNDYVSVLKSLRSFIKNLHFHHFSPKIITNQSQVPQIESISADSGGNIYPTTSTTIELLGEAPSDTMSVIITAAGQQLSIILSEAGQTQITFNMPSISLTQPVLSTVEIEVQNQLSNSQTFTLYPLPNVAIIQSISPSSINYVQNGNVIINVSIENLVVEISTVTANLIDNTGLTIPLTYLSLSNSTLTFQINFTENINTTSSNITVTTLLELYINSTLICSTSLSLVEVVIIYPPI